MSDTARPKSAGDLMSADEINKDLPILLNAGETINGATLPVASFMSAGDESEEAKITQAETDSQYQDCNGVRWVGQTFTLDANTTIITKIRLYLTKLGAPSGNVTVGIYAVDGSSDPTGSALGEKAILASTLNGGALQDFEFASPIIVSPSTKYALVIKCPDGTAGNEPGISREHNSNPYAGGEMLNTTNGGTSWGNPGWDLKFIVYGYLHLTTGKIFQSNANITERKKFHFFAISNSTDGNDITIQTKGIVSGFTGLTTGSKYYVQDDGTIGTSMGTAEILVGIAISATQILILMLHKY